MIVGSGNFQYRMNAEWAKLPDGWSFKEVGGVGVDSHDNVYVYVFNRGEHPMMIFDREGKFLRSWGEGQYPRAQASIWRPTTRCSSPMPASISAMRASGHANRASQSIYRRLGPEACKTQRVGRLISRVFPRPRA
jgi:hypothetical protein